MTETSDKTGVTLTIPGFRFATLNELMRGHWAHRSRLKRRDRCAVALFARLAGLSAAAGKRRVSVSITYSGRQQAADVDAYWKSLLDALVAAGLLVDDSPAWCEIGEVRQARGETTATVIELENVEP